MRINPPLVALSVGAFGIGVTEFAPMGMLPGIAADLDVSIPAAGLLVSAYAMGVLIGAPIMTLATARVPRRYLLIGLMAIFTLGNLLSALASNYQTLMIARLVTSLNHGAFFGIGSIVAASLVAPEKRAGAVAAMFMGLTLATIGGVPLATWFGENFGWRTAFWGISGLGAVDLGWNADFGMSGSLCVIGLHGGGTMILVPELAKLYIDRHILPGETREQATRQIEELSERFAHQQTASDDLSALQRTTKDRQAALTAERRKGEWQYVRYLWFCEQEGDFE